MFSVKLWGKLLTACAFLTLAACGDNLAPSGTDQRPPVQSGTTGGAVGQNAPDFAVSDTGGATITLASALASRRGAVFYFTMWCPICDQHMSDMRSVIPQYPSVGFYLVDYVSATVTDAGSAAAANGYSGGGFTTLADVSHILMGDFQGTMGTTVVIDRNGIVRMNEDYKDGVRFREVLAALP